MSTALITALAQFDAATSFHFSRVPELNAQDLRDLAQLSAAYELPELADVFAREADAQKPETF